MRESRRNRRSLTTSFSVHIRAHEKIEGRKGRVARLDPGGREGGRVQGERGERGKRKE